MKKSRQPKLWKASYRARIVGSANLPQFNYTDINCIGKTEDGTIDILLLSPPSQGFKSINFYNHQNKKK